MDTSQTSNSSPAADPLVFNLHNDILLHIFHLNTHATETEYYNHDFDPTPFCPLNIARHTSQVCHVWRQIMLRSPAIWGSMIDMTSIERSCEKWAEELLRRTGKAGLSIYGRVGFSFRNHAFFKSMLIRHWHRVRRFDLLVYEEGYIDSDMWDIIFHRPAPILEKFILHYGQDPPTTSPAENRGPIFAKNAPFLRRFHCADLKIDLKFNTTWISQLRGLTLDIFNDRPMNTIEVLSILRTTPHLESLVIYDSTSLSNIEGPADWETRIHLPTLRLLDITADADLSILYLRSIVPHPDCSLALNTSDDFGTVGVDQLDILVSNIASYLERYVVKYKSPILVLHLEPLSIKFSREPAETDMKYFAHPAFDLFFGGQVSAPIMHHYQLLSTLASIPLGCITELKLLGDEPLTIEPDDPNLLTFITALSSVRTLRITGYTFQLLNSACLGSDPIPFPFPFLSTVEFVDRFALFMPKFLARNLLAFLLHRKATDIPALTVDLGVNSGMGHWYDGCDWAILDVIEGLKVVWKTNSTKEVHICGSGNLSLD